MQKSRMVSLKQLGL